MKIDENYSPHFGVGSENLSYQTQAQSITYFQMILARYHSLTGLFLVQGGNPSHDAGFH